MCAGFAPEGATGRDFAGLACREVLYATDRRAGSSGWLASLDFMS